jgi:regulator of nonsense transcripts 2
MHAYLLTPAPAIAREPRPVLYEYVRKLLHDSLNESNLSVILQKLLCLSWEDNYEESVFENLFDVSQVSTERLALFSRVLSQLNGYYPFATYLVDEILEEIRYGLEANDFKDYQNRLSYARYLGHLFNCGMVDFSVVPLWFVRSSS